MPDSRSNPWQVTIKESKPNEMEKYSLYSDYTTDQKKGFVELIKLIDECITMLQQEGELSDYVKINARIKSAESALANDTRESKVLDDVFGVEILAGNENALRKILNKLEMYMTSKRENIHDKPNGYKAIHRVMNLKEKTFLNMKSKSSISYDNIPMIEVQFKTFEVKENAVSGSANHLHYKGQTKEEIQRIFDNNGFNEHNLPIMFTIENHKIRILSKQETIRDLYPFLKFKNDKEKGEEKQ